MDVARYYYAMILPAHGSVRARARARVCDTHMCVFMCVSVCVLVYMCLCVTERDGIYIGVLTITLIIITDICPGTCPKLAQSAGDIIIIIIVKMSLRKLIIITVPDNHTNDLISN